MIARGTKYCSNLVRNFLNNITISRQNNMPEKPKEPVERTSLKEIFAKLKMKFELQDLSSDSSSNEQNQSETSVVTVNSANDNGCDDNLNESSNAESKNKNGSCVSTLNITLQKKKTTQQSRINNLPIIVASTQSENPISDSENKEEIYSNQLNFFSLNDENSTLIKTRNFENDDNTNVYPNDTSHSDTQSEE